MRTKFMIAAATISIAALVGCTTKLKEPQAEVKMLRPLEQTTLVQDLTPYIDRVEILNLEIGTEPNPTSKIIVNPQNNHLYYLDQNSRIIELDQNGKLVRTVANRGRGPGEFLSAMSIALSDNAKELYILEDTQVKIADLTTGAMRSIPIPKTTAVDDIAPAQNSSIYGFCAYSLTLDDSSSDMLVNINENGEIVKSNLPRTDFTTTMFNISQSSGNRYFLRPQNSEHIFYEILPDSVYARYQIDFQTQNIPNRYYYDKADENMMQYIMADYYKMPIYLYETDNLLCFGASAKGGDEYKFLYNKQTDTGVRWKHTSLEFKDPYFNIIASDTDSFYILLERYAVVEYSVETAGDHSALFNALCAKIQEQGVDGLGETFIAKLHLVSPK